MLTVLLGIEVLNKHCFPFTTVPFIQVLHRVKMTKNDNESRKKGNKWKKSLRFGTMTSERCPVRWVQMSNALLVRGVDEQGYFGTR